MNESPPARRPLRWWPAILLLAAAVLGVVWVRGRDEVPFQQRNLATAKVTLGALALLLLWWTLLSRAPKRLRRGVLLGVLFALVASIALFRIRGVSGDLVPILEPRWVKRGLPVSPVQPVAAVAPSPALAPSPADFPQFLGPERTGVLSGPKLAADWIARPPVILWRQKVGPAWSGFSVAAGRAFTQEQRGGEEWVSCYEPATGRLLWSHADSARYFTTIAGEGPRATPTVTEGRVFTLGGTGLLNCLEAANGKKLWSRNLAGDAGARVPDWGFAGSPLIVDDLVVVSAGGRGKSLLACRLADGRLAWSAGSAPAGYASPFLTTLAGVRQVLAFNTRTITAHDAGTGAVLWEHPWSVLGQSVCNPVVVDDRRVLFSSGYGVGSELLEIRRREDGRLSAGQAWASKRMKAKFANLVTRAGFLYGLDDGILACVDLRDGSQRWKEGRYGHGQGLLVGEFYLLMAEGGELVLLRPTPEGPDERARFRVFTAKTWNPIALAGDLLLVRNDQEAACLRLPLEP